MAKPNDGGPAYPLAAEFNEEGEITSEAQKGMSLRAWLAGQAMGSNDLGTNGFPIAAKWCVEFADAVIAELDKEADDKPDEDLDDLPADECGACDRKAKCEAEIAAEAKAAKETP